MYEQLGDTHSLLVARANLAMNLWQKDAIQHRDEVQRLLCLALQAARRMRLPEAAQIEEILGQRGLSYIEP